MASNSMMTSLKHLTSGVEDLTQEFKDFLSTLPRDTWFSHDRNPLYQYQGFWNVAPLLQGMLKCQAHFKAQPTDLFLASIPKSGTTWLKAMVFATVNRNCYPTTNFVQHPQHPLLAKNPHELVPSLEFAYAADPSPPDFTDFESPRLFATHLAYTLLPDSVMESKCRIVYLCRNPKDTLISYWIYNNKQFGTLLKEPISLEDMFEKFCKGVTAFGPFWDHVLGYWKQSLENPERVCFLKYEDIKSEPNIQLRKLGEFLRCPFSVEEEKEGILEGILKLCSFNNLSNLEVNKKGELAPGLKNNALFRRGEVGDWVNHLTPEMGERLDRITEEKFIGSGLKF